MNTELTKTRSETTRATQQSSGPSLPKHAKISNTNSAALQIQEILVPTDFPEHSNAALRYAMSIAKQFNARITLLHIIEPPTACPDVAYLGAASSDNITSAAEESIARMWEREKSRGPLAWQSMVQEGVPYQVIVQTAKTQKTDLIIVATHGRTGLAHVLLGSTAEKVVRNVPVQIVSRHGAPSAEIIKAAKDMDVDMIVMSTHGRTGRIYALIGSVAGDVARLAPCPVLVVRAREHEFVQNQYNPFKTCHV
jgi:universal stress protein A